MSAAENIFALSFLKGAAQYQYKSYKNHGMQTADWEAFHILCDAYEALRSEEDGISRE